MATTALGNKAVGSTIKLNVNGTAKEFIVVHQEPNAVAAIDEGCLREPSVAQPPLLTSHRRRVDFAVGLYRLADDLTHLLGVFLP